MFIVHGAWFRRNIRWLLGLVLLLLIPSFIFLYTHTDSTRGRQLEVPTIDGEPVNPALFERTYNLVMSEMLLNSGGQLPNTERLGEMLRQEALMRLLMLREAEQLGIRVSDNEVIEYIRGQRAFQNEQGQFDPERYRQFTIRLTNSRINEAQFEEIMRQQMIIQRLEDIITLAAKVTPQEVRQAFEAFNEQMVVDYVTFSAAAAPPPPAPTAEQLQTYFDANQEAFRTDRQVKVRYVRIPLDEAAQTVTDDDVKAFYERSGDRFTNTLEQATETIRAELRRTRAYYAAGDRATELTVRLVPERGAPPTDFAKIAAELGLTMETTGFFGPQDEVAGVNAGREFNQAAFALTTSAPISDPVEGTDGYYVLQLIEVQDSEIPPFDAVKDKVQAAWTEQQARDALVKHGQDVAEKLRTAVASGKSFADACAELKLKPTTSEPFTLGEDASHLPAQGFIKETALGMKVGAVSDFLRTPTGGVVFHLQQRTPAAAEEFEKNREQYAAMLARQHREAIWQAWVQDLWARENVSL